MKIYTKTGDKGQTSLYGGKRCNKDEPLVEAYGTIDELSSAIGVAIAEINKQQSKINNKEIEFRLPEIQSDLFAIGALLAGDRRKIKDQKSKIKERIEKMEEMIDWMAQRLPQQRHFILPGGSKQAALLQLARAVCRRAERRVVALKIKNQRSKIKNKEKEIVDHCLIYLNRLSDFLFTLAKWVNKDSGVIDVEWKSEI